VTARDTLLPAIDRIRSLGGIFGLRLFTVTVRLRTQDGERPEIGGFTDLNTPVVNQLPVPTLFIGTVAVTSGLTAVTGIGTIFTQQARVPFVVQFANQPGVNYLVSSISSDTALTLTFPFTGATTASTTMQSSATPVLVSQLSRREVIASAGLYTDRDLRVGRMTPPYPAGAFGAAGGFDDSTIDPLAINGAAAEVFWLVSGPGYPAAGAWFDKVGEEFTALHAYVILRANGRTL
jgi:hypothetical protein